MYCYVCSVFFFSFFFCFRGGSLSFEYSKIVLFFPSLNSDMVPIKHLKCRVKHGVIINIGLVAFLIVLLGLVDCCAWRIVRLPLEPFYLMRPFCISAVVVSCAGFVCIPLLRSLKIRSIIRQEGPVRHSSKTGTPTMGGLFFVPIGIIVAEVLVGFSSIEVTGAAAATLAFAAIGLLDDVRIIKNHNYGLSAWMKILLEVKHSLMHPFFSLCHFLFVHLL